MMSPNVVWDRALDVEDKIFAVFYCLPYAWLMALGLANLVLFVVNIVLGV